MAETKDNVVLRLVLDAAGAKKEADAYVGTLNELGSKAQQIAGQMQNTISGRLLGGLANAVSTTLGRVFNDELPQALASAELQIKGLEAAVGAIAGEQAGALAGSLARKGFQGDVNAAKGAFGTVQRLQSVFPGTPLAPEDVRIVADASFRANQQVERTSQALRVNFNEALPGDRIRFNTEAIAQAGQEALNAAADAGKNLGGAAVAAGKKLVTGLIGG